MLADPHFKVLDYSPNSRKFFPNKDIKGGIAITYRDTTKEFGAIETFISIPLLRNLATKVESCNEDSLKSIIFPPLSYDVSQQMKLDHPNSLHRLRTSAFKELPEIFYTTCPNDGHDYVQILGLENRERAYRWIRRDYVRDKYEKLDKWEVIVPEANGSGALGEVLSTPLIGQPLIGQPLIGHTQTFMTIGRFDSEPEAAACLKYVKSKFARALLGALKTTQHNPPKTWRFVPLQDFTAHSDIDWSLSISEIDQQLYKKYGLTEEEIAFIETNVKEMD